MNKFNNVESCKTIMDKKSLAVVFGVLVVMSALVYSNFVSAETIHRQYVDLGQIYPGETITDTIEFYHYGEGMANVYVEEVSNDNKVIYSYKVSDTIQLESGTNTINAELHIDGGSPVGNVDLRITIVEIKE